MVPEDFNFGRGQVVYWDIENLDQTIPLLKQLNFLKEDLIQVRFDKNTLVDVGWYPEFSANGAFTVTVIRDENWDEPLHRIKAESIQALYSAIEEGVRVAVA
jgi:hypothetical protein